MAVRVGTRLAHQNTAKTEHNTWSPQVPPTTVSLVDWATDEC